jgi:Tfp pilus assembly protein PilV
VRRRDAGETLIEVVISMLLLTMAVGAVLSAVGAGALFSGDHRALVASDVAAKRVAERVKGLTYVPSAGASAYDAAESTVPAGYLAVVGPVTCWPGGTGTAATTEAFVACTSADLGLQLVTVTVSTSDGTLSETTQVMKRRP